MTFSHFFRLAPLALMAGFAGHAGAEPAQQPSRGAYLATASDCAACHTNGHDGVPFAGGYRIASPMGAITSSNITPSMEFGIGTYTLDDFAAALRDGIRKDGAHLYPAMPYPAYSRLRDDDIAALYDYFMTEVQPVDTPAPETELPFPFSQRWAMIGWNALYGGGKPLQADPGQSDAWNRGRYLVQGPAHCGTCHTPRNLMMGSDHDNLLAGGAVGAWFAPNLTPTGLRGWTDADLTAYLKTGVATHARASGPMAEAVEFSLQHLEDDDLAAIVTYLRSLPAKGEAPAAPAPKAEPAAFVPAEHAQSRTEPMLEADASGPRLYEAVCASCHGLTGDGSPDGTYPALGGNVTLSSLQSANLVSTILHGVTREVDGKRTLMPGFGPDSLVQKLSDEQVATLASYTAQQFGDDPATVTAADVETIRTGGPVAPLVKLAAPQIMIGAAIAALLVLVLI
ncbi:MAG: c-type cytochrome, partial [Paracoccus sp. (in: a-proteobacteria)]|nr:c-type cytochrome [Paracoccus sp. (in: a-proteobacteria)]